MDREKQIVEFTARLQQAGGPNLICAVLYGSAAADDFHEGFSDLNVLCVLRDVSADALRKLSPAVIWWVKQKNPPPVILAAGELARDAEMFPIEMLDIQRQHRLLSGEAVIARLQVSMDLHRIQLEHELRTKLQLLRQRYAAMAGNQRQAVNLMANSISGFATLFRHALLAIATEPPPDRIHMIRAIARRAGFEETPFNHLFQLRRHERRAQDFDAHGTFTAYVQAIEKVTELVSALPYSPGLCSHDVREKS
jgi:hypothetical protein